MNKFVCSLFLTLGSLFSSPLFATAVALTEWGTLTSVVLGTCPDNSCSPGDVLNNPITTEVIVDGFNNISAATGSVVIPQGTAQASAEVTGGLATPILRTRASSVTESWVGSGAFAIQGYEYTGMTTETVILNIKFDGVITNPHENTVTGFGVGMYLFAPEQLPVSTTTVPDTFLGLLALYADFYALNDNLFYELEATQHGNVIESGQISIELNPGELFYLAGGVLASAGGQGASADAYSTLTVDIAPKFAGVLDVASIATIPLPSAIWFFIPALLGLIGCKQSGFIVLFPKPIQI